MVVNLQSSRVQWLLDHVGQVVKVQCGSMTYEGKLRFCNGTWEVKFCEFTSNDISSYGYDLGRHPYVILIGDQNG